MAFLNLIRYKNLLVILFLQCLLRYGLILPILDFHGIEPVMPHWKFIVLVIATLFLAASGYVINDYFDLRIDRINRPGKIIVGRYFQRRSVMLLHVVFTIIGMFSGLLLAYITRKETYALMFIAIPMLLWVYSTFLKRHVLIGNLTISFLTALVPYVVVSLEFASLAQLHGTDILVSEAASTAWFWVTGFAFFAFVSNLGREIIKDIEDMRGDKIAGCKTLPIAIGKPNTKAIVIMLSLFTIVAIWGLFFSIAEIRYSMVVALYFLIFLTLPHLILIWLVYSARTQSHFYNASQLSKIIMLFGILFIVVARMLLI